MSKDFKSKSFNLKKLQKMSKIHAKQAEQILKNKLRTKTT